MKANNISKMRKITVNMLIKKRKMEKCMITGAVSSSRRAGKCRSAQDERMEMI